MHYINHYHSPLGTILLAADDTGLTGLWFEGQKYFAQGLDKETEEKEFSVFQTARRCWMFISQGRRLTSRFLFIFREPPFRRRYGRFSYPFPTAKPPLTEPLQSSWLQKEAFRICPPRQWAVRSATTRFLLSFPATV